MGDGRARPEWAAPHGRVDDSRVSVTRRESPMVQNRERQPHTQLRLFVVSSGFCWVLWFAFFLLGVVGCGCGLWAVGCGHGSGVSHLTVHLRTPDTPDRSRGTGLVDLACGLIWLADYTLLEGKQRI